MNECEVLDTMQSEFLDVQQAVYVTTRRDVVEKYLEREHCMREDFRSKIIRVQREAANMKVEMKQCLTKRKEGLGSFKSLHEHKLGE